MTRISTYHHDGRGRFSVNGTLSPNVSKSHKEIPTQLECLYDFSRHKSLGILHSYPNTTQFTSLTRGQCKEHVNVRQPKGACTRFSGVK